MIRNKVKVSIVTKVSFSIKARTSFRFYAGLFLLTAELSICNRTLFISTSTVEQEIVKGLPDDSSVPNACKGVALLYQCFVGERRN